MGIWLTSATQSAYNEGVEAARPVLKGCGSIEERICPYAEGTNEFRAWHDGLQDGTDAIISKMASQAELDDRSASHTSWPERKASNI